jgi:heat-inducible transcriptional repressor
MRTPVIHDKRGQSILADIIRLYIETGEPVSSRSISRRHGEPLSPATIRNVMADLEEEGFLFQPHTSAGRVPTAAAYRFYAQQIAREGTPEPDDREWIERELGAAQTPEELMERASHVLSALSKGLGIVVTPALSQTVLEHVRFVLLPDGRVVVVLVAAGGAARDKVVRVERVFTQSELDRTADFLNSQYRGWTLDRIRGDLASKIESERERYDRLAANALALCAPEVLGDREPPHVYVEGAAQIATAPEFSGQQELRALLGAIEEKKKLVALLTSCIEAPEPVHIQIGINEISNAGPHLALISAPFAQNEGAQGSLGVLGPMRMHYERAITAVAHVARLFGQRPDRSGT